MAVLYSAWYAGCMLCLRGHEKDGNVYANNSCKTCANDRARDFNQKIRQLAFEAYGLSCRCCGETRRSFLTIDHVDGGGTQHRQSLTHHGGTMKWLYKNGYPPGFQTLCWNCNWSKHLLGVCEHAQGAEASNRSASPRSEVGAR